MRHLFSSQTRSLSRRSRATCGTTPDSGESAFDKASTNRRKKPAFVPMVDGLEQRLVLTAQPLAHAAVVAHPVVHALSTVSSLNQKVVKFLASKVGSRIGGGECAHIATEALRVAGAKFVQIANDNPASGDYVWGSLVKIVTAKNGKAVDSAPSAAVQPGDIIQYRNAKFSAGNTVVRSSAGSFASHHTSVVAAVDSLGRPTKVYEQNFNGVRTMAVHAINLSRLTGGWLRIYHPVARPNVSGRYEFTIVNNSSSRQTITVNGKPKTLTPANTAGSYTSYWATGGQPSLTLNGNSPYKLDNAAGYQIVGSGSAATLKKLV
jgi:hypothetical protein